MTSEEAEMLALRLVLNYESGNEDSRAGEDVVGVRGLAGGCTHLRDSCFVVDD